MADTFQNYATTIESPARKAFSITPDDNNDLAVMPRAIYTGAGGAITLIAADDTTAVTLNFVPAGAILPIRANRILATGTTPGMGMIGLA